jgi:AcrR family transcriptional regulator
LTTKENIVNTALLLFTQKGFQGVSIRDIARKAGVSISVIYHHFTDKQDLVVQAIENSYFFLHFQALKEYLSRTGLDPTEKVDNLVMFEYELEQKCRRELREAGFDGYSLDLMFFEAVNLIPEIKDKFYSLYHECVEILSESIAAGQKSHHYNSKPDSRKTALSLMLMLDGLYLYATDLNEDGMKEAYLDVHETALLVLR